jgi:hypothetical protein
MTPGGMKVVPCDQLTEAGRRARPRSVGEPVVESGVFALLTGRRTARLELQGVGWFTTRARTLPCWSVRFSLSSVSGRRQPRAARSCGRAWRSRGLDGDTSSSPRARITPCGLRGEGSAVTGLRRGSDAAQSAGSRFGEQGTGPGRFYDLRGRQWPRRSRSARTNHDRSRAAQARPRVAEAPSSRTRRPTVRAESLPLPVQTHRGGRNDRRHPAGTSRAVDVTAVRLVPPSTGSRWSS